VISCSPAEVIYKAQEASVKIRKIELQGKLLIKLAQEQWDFATRWVANQGFGDATKAAEHALGPIPDYEPTCHSHAHLATNPIVTGWITDPFREPKDGQLAVVESDRFIDGSVMDSDVKASSYWLGVGGMESRLAFPHEFVIRYLPICT
jgi:hypothetical protein